MTSALEAHDLDSAVLSIPLRQQLYDQYMTEANRWAEQLQNEKTESLITLDGAPGELQFFVLPGLAYQSH